MTRRRTIGLTFFLFSQVFILLGSVRIYLLVVSAEKKAARKRTNL